MLRAIDFFTTEPQSTQRAPTAQSAQQTHSCRHCRWLYFLSLFFLEQM